ncbi:hypothetical protein G6045_05930 [Streptomyces sp. YC504]|uniref:Immunity protein 35 domain-containing protein n=1 Tax=Streptomyces mesophilus TaxID=1775132 RepID=A0A6G4XDH8_9ACTN|nr:hypothetical protein [Streptomyces mesophilus]NGO75222.1 hypothetical protein [Streptomyces mesophilus]
MAEQAEALQLAVGLVERSQHKDEPALDADTERVREGYGLLIVPYNSVEYLASRNVRHQLLGCWPILDDLTTGDV